MQKTRLTQNNKAKHTSNAKKKKKNTEGREKKVTESLGAIFRPHLGRAFSFNEPLIRWQGGRVKTVQT